MGLGEIRKRIEIKRPTDVLDVLDRAKNPLPVSKVQRRLRITHPLRYLWEPNTNRTGRTLLNLTNTKEVVVSVAGAHEGTKSGEIMVYQKMKH